MNTSKSFVNVVSISKQCLFVTTVLFVVEDKKHILFHVCLVSLTIKVRVIVAYVYFMPSDWVLYKRGPYILNNEGPFGFRTSYAISIGSTVGTTSCITEWEFTKLLMDFCNIFRNLGS